MLNLTTIHFLLAMYIKAFDPSMMTCHLCMYIRINMSGDDIITFQPISLFYVVA